MADSSLALAAQERSSRLGLALFVLVAAALPLLLSPLVPAVDFNAHLLRYVILADDGATPFLERNYSPDWKLVTNLGVDVLGVFLLKVAPPLVAGRLIALLLMLAVYGGALLLAHAVQGQLRPFTILLAGFLVHSYIFAWGFSNFLLGLGIGLAGLAVWIRTAANPRRQLLLAILFGVALMLCHALAFGFWGVMLGAFELGRAIEQRDLSLRSLVVRAARLASIAIIPAAVFLASRTSDTPEGVTAAVGHLKAYADSGLLAERLWTEAVRRLDLLLRVSDSGFPAADRVIGSLLWVLILGGLATGATRLSSRMWLPVLFAFGMALVIPPNLFGSGYVNHRLPLLLMALLAAGLVASESHRLARPLIVAVAALLAVHLGLVAVYYWRAGHHFNAFIASISAVDTGETAGFLGFSGSGRDGLARLCSPSLILLALENRTAVQTFVYPGMQPLLLDGALAKAIAQSAALRTPDVRATDLADTTTGRRQMRIGQLLDSGFDSVFVCDGAGPPPAPAGVRDVARGENWAIYRKSPGASASVR